MPNLIIKYQPKQTPDHPEPSPPACPCGEPGQDLGASPQVLVHHLLPGGFVIFDHSRSQPISLSTNPNQSQILVHHILHF